LSRKECLWKEAQRIIFNWKVMESEETTKIVQSDLCSVEIPTPNGCKHFITFIGDFSKKLLGYIS
jgi:hypothetical protein